MVDYGKCKCGLTPGDGKEDNCGRAIRFQEGQTIELGTRACLLGRCTQCNYCYLVDGMINKISSCINR